MWPTDTIWGNTLIFTAAGGALIIAAFLGSVLGRSSEGRRAMKAASIGLGILILCYVAAAMSGIGSNTEEGCIYAPAHPSDC
jgi:VIT1/CCC1 family predicted Fe2+/Mn2+ transporter